MKPSAIILALALSVSAGSLTAKDKTAAPQAGDRPPPPPEGGAQGGQQQHPGGPRLLPPGAAEALKLTAEQQKQINELEADIKAKLEKILTPEQMDQLKQIRPPRQAPPRDGAPGADARPPADGAGAAPDGQGNPDGQGPPPRPPMEQ